VESLVESSERIALSVRWKPDNADLIVLFFLESRHVMVIDCKTCSMNQWGKWLITDENKILINEFKFPDKGYQPLNATLEKEVFKWLSERELLKNCADTTISNKQQESVNEQRDSESN